MTLGNKTISLGNGATYIYNPTHRNGNPNKSQWIISENDELICFQQGYQTCQSIIGNGHTYWGIYLVNNQIDYLGTAVAKSNSDRLFIAKFVDSTKNSEWHGYPADHVSKYPEDSAPEQILFHWVSQGVLHKKKISKIVKGRKCSL